MKITTRIIFLMMFCIFVIPFTKVHADTLADYLNNVVGPSEQYSTRVSPAYLRNNSEEEYVNPQNGDLSVIQTDYSLQGRNGLNLEIKRIYKSGIANLHDMKTYFNSSTGTWVDYTQSDASTASFYENRYGLGIGQRFSFPAIEVIQNSDGTSTKYLHSESGDVYRLSGPTTVNNIKTYTLDNHPIKDIDIREDSSYTNGQSDGTSQFVMIAKDGKKTYFASDGRILSIKDRYNNLIKFEYGTYTYTVDEYTRNRRLINKITDTMGRIVNIVYKEDQNFILNPPSGYLQGKFEVEIYLPDNTPNDLTDNKKIVYEKNSSLYSGKSLHSIREKIQQVYDIDNQLKYEYWYDTNYNAFTFQNGNNRTVTNTYENLIQINYYKTNKLKRYYYGTYVKSLGASGSMEYKKITQIQNLAKTNIDDTRPFDFDKFTFDTINTISYKYTNEPDGYGYAGYNASDNNYLKNTYRFYTEKTEPNGTGTIYTYDGVQQLLSVKNYSAYYEIDTNSTYDNNKLPLKQIKQTYYLYDDDGPIGPPTTEIENYAYDQYGNLLSYTGPGANRDSNGNPIDDKNTISYTMLQINIIYFHQRHGRLMAIQLQE